MVGSKRVKSEVDDAKMATNSLADPIALGKIDGLFACGAGDYIALPQLVVVGDQSSGKSSVLQAFVDLPFPRDSGLCTRFATQLMFRRAPQASISVSIIPATNASQDHAAHVKGWAKANLKSLNAEAFAEIMKEVHERMSLGGQNGAAGKATFSEDVLRLEVSGPDQEHFSVVDVPGIFRKTTMGVTTMADRDLVKSVVCRYMENPRSVMLAVIPANVDIATQEILTLAEEHDPDGIRTIGVLTKPDLVDAGAEGPIVELVRGKGHKLSLGWFIVRNAGQKQLEDPKFDRNATERLFFQSKAPWNSLDATRVGVEALRVSLQEVLAAHIRKEFPKVKLEISKKLANAKEDLKALGAKRDTTEEQRQYLSDLSMQFQDIAAHALLAQYVSNNWFDEHSESLKFATLVRNRSEKFSLDVQAYGQSYLFENENADLELDSTRLVGTKPSAEKPRNVDEISSRTRPDHPDLEDVTADTSISISKLTGKGILEWLATIYRTSRGLELGTFDSKLLPMSFKTQSAKWEGLTMGYIGDIITMAHGFIDHLLGLICTDLRIKEGLLSILMDDLRSKYGAAMQSAEFLLYVERQGTPATMNHYFSDGLDKSRQARFHESLKEKAVKLDDGRNVIEVDSVKLDHSMSNEQTVVMAIHDILKAYYKVARKRFVDNVIMQASDFHLVTGPKTPLKLFSQSFVNRLDKEQLEEIAGEDTALKRKRAALTKEIDGLEKGRKVLR